MELRDLLMLTVMGTVGFWDITQESTLERLYILLLMLVSTCIFSRLMGDMNMCSSSRPGRRLSMIV
jgi:hypothetical protein